MTGESDDHVVAAVLTGDSEGCPEFWRNISERLEAFARYGGLSGPDAADVVQQTLAHAVAEIRKGHHHGEASLTGWIYGIFRHKLADFHRSFSRSSARETALEVVLPSGEFGARWLTDATPDAEQVAIVESALSRLGARERAALILKELYGLAAHEFAPLLGISKRTASDILTRARQQLAEIAAEGRKSPPLKRLKR